MRINFILIITLLFWENSFPQYWAWEQPPSIYKQNNVRSRTRVFKGDIYRNGQVDYFDRAGLLVESGFYDTSGKVCFSKSLFKYDSAGHLIAETKYQYQYMDTIEKKPAIRVIPDSQIVKFEFDSMNRVVKKSFFSYKTLFQWETTYDPLILTQTTFDTDSTTYVSIWQFDDKGRGKAVASTRFSKDGEVLYVSVYKYKNSYDKNGRLRKRKIKLVSDPSQSNEVYFRNEEYHYLENGLLENGRMYNTGGKGEFYGQDWSYDYKFWE